jgi:hypothetical protein
MKNTYKIITALLVLSIFSLIYFILLVYWSYNPPESTGMIRFFGELLTIPLLLIVPSNIIISIYYITKKLLVGRNLIILSINTLTLGILIITTILE